MALIHNANPILIIVRECLIKPH
uniref:Uncharacterized protein n=1 Tax=Anguilla anguilla TaxID=7936 RepID=A0A0E9QUX7_ANGAN